jgi:hypothetical protein
MRLQGGNETDAGHERMGRDTVVIGDPGDVNMNYLPSHRVRFQHGARFSRK